MFCKKCGQELPEGTRFCTGCGAQTAMEAQQAPPVQPAQPVMNQSYQMPMMPPKKKFPAWAIVLIVIGALIGVALIGNVFGGSGNDVNSLTGYSSKPLNSLTSNVSSQQQKDIYGLNEAATFEGVTISVNKVEKSNGSTFDKPKDGMEYVIVHVTIKNTGKEKISYNPYDYKMSNSKGQIVDHGLIVVDSDTALGSGELAPGGEVVGTISFEQLKDDPGLVLEYYDNSFFDDEASLKFRLN